MFARTKTDLTSPDYPDWDRRTNAMPDQHRGVLDATLHVLHEYFAGDPMVYVSGNTPVFFEKDGRRTRVIPDVYVVKGVRKQKRRGYRVWEEGKGPDVVFELTSRSSCREDAENKFALYQDTLAVQEYLLFDPLGDSLEPALQGYRLTRGRYRRIKEVAGRIQSRALGLQVERRGGELHFYDPLTAKYLPKGDAEWSRNT